MFLKEIQQTKYRKIKIKQLLILLFRILMITFLVLMFAQPFQRGYLPEAGESVRSSVLLVLDNSFSMEARSDSGNVFDDAKKKLIETIKMLNDKDEIYFVTTSQLGNEGGNVLYDNKDALIDSVKNTKISAVTRNLDYIMYFSDRILNSSTNTFKEYFLFTDGQKSTFLNSTGSGSKINNDENRKYNIVLCGKRTANNLSIDTIDVTSKIFQKNKSIKLKTTVTNHDNFDAQNISLNMVLEGTRKTPYEKSVDIKANSSVDIEFSFVPESTGSGGGYIELGSAGSSGMTAADEFKSDNRRYFSYMIHDKINVLLVAGSDKDVNYIKLAISSSEELVKDSTGATVPYYSVKQIGENDLTNELSSISGYNCIIISNKKSFTTVEADKLYIYVQNGGGIIIYPGDNTDITNYNSVLFKKFELNGINGTFGEKNGGISLRFDKIDFDHPIFEGIFKTKDVEGNTVIRESPLIKFGLNFMGGINAIPLIQLNNERNFLVEYSIGKGKILCYAVSPDAEYSDFPEKNIFPPITVRSILYLSDINPTKEAETGKDYFFDIENLGTGQNDSLTIAQIYDPKNIFKIPVYNNRGAFNLKNIMNNASNYRVSFKDKTINEFPCNFDKKESMPAKLNKSEIASLFNEKYQIKPNIISPEDEFKSSLLGLRSGRELWKYFLILAILFFTAEFVISRLMISRKAGKETTG